MNTSRLWPHFKSFLGNTCTDQSKSLSLFVKASSTSHTYIALCMQIEYKVYIENWVLGVQVRACKLLDLYNVLLVWLLQRYMCVFTDFSIVITPLKQNIKKLRTLNIALPESDTNIDGVICK